MSDTVSGRATKAAALLENPIFKEAFDGVRQKIVEAIERCPMKEREDGEDLRRSLKLLKGVREAIEAHVKHGQIVEFRLQQEAEQRERRRIGLIPNFFR
jgi:hypothetical protein